MSESMDKSRYEKDRGSLRRSVAGETLQALLNAVGKFVSNDFVWLASQELPNSTTYARSSSPIQC